MVVAKDSQTERRKIDRCASATPSVSSKMSRWRNTEIQASVENCHFTSP